jgi:hypothetical protein
MTVSTTDIPVLHSAEVVHLYAQFVLPICHGFDRTQYTSTKEARKSTTTRPLQSSTSFRKPAIVSKERSIGMPYLKSHRSKINLRTSLYLPLPYCLCPFQVR